MVTGCRDGAEVRDYFSSPLLADTDGDLIPDGVEATTDTEPDRSKQLRPPEGRGQHHRGTAFVHARPPIRCSAIYRSS